MCYHVYKLMLCIHYNHHYDLNRVRALLPHMINTIVTPFTPTPTTTGMPPSIPTIKTSSQSTTPDSRRNEFEVETEG